MLRVLVACGSPTSAFTDPAPNNVGVEDAIIGCTVAQFPEDQGRTVVLDRLDGNMVTRIGFLGKESWVRM
jgi:hypothetical protein